MEPTRPSSIIRSLTKADHNFVLKSWLREARKAPEFRRMPSRTFFDHFEEVIQAILRSPRVTALCAARADNTAWILSFVVIERDLPLLHMAYTEGNWRGYGFARDVFKAAGVDYNEPIAYTFPTRKTERLVRRRPGALYVGPAALARYSI